MGLLFRNETIERHAFIEDNYRYWLERRWANGPACLFIMLNPSTADAQIDDPTIRRCMAFAKRFHCAALEVVNLYAWRATDPRWLWKAKDPVGPVNDEHILCMAKKAHLTIVAWGANARLDRATQVLALLSNAGVKPLCLGVTSSGAPKHPLYLKTACDLVPYEEALLA